MTSSMNIDSKLVGKLREMSGAPLMDCKRALQEANGDFEAAFDILRKKGLKAAEKRAGRKAGAGRTAVKVSADQRSGAVVLMTSETDFVPPTDDFRGLLDKLAAVAFDRKVATVDALLAQPLDGADVAEALKALTGKCGENVELAQVAYFDNPKGYVGGYVHHDNKTAGFCSVTTDAPKDKALEFLKQLGMHVTFAKPQALSREQIGADAIERERGVYRDSEDVKSKPEDRREKIVQGKLEKYFSTVALLEQPWFKDDKQTVAKVLAAELGAGARIEAFALFQIG
jgi:elongation factor Ts